MKILLTLCSVLIAIANIAQPSGKSAELLKVEWKTELQIPKDGAQLTDLIIGGDKLYYSMRGRDGSGIFAQDLNSLVPAPIVENSFMQNLNYMNGKLFTMGGCHLIRRNTMAISESEFCLQLQENWTLSAVEGRVVGASAYGLHWANKLAAYDLNGDLKWSKEIAELTQNQFLQYGGGYLYVYSQINKPSLGPRLMQYDTLGNQKWSLSIVMVNNILADHKGNIYVFSIQPQTSNIVSKYNSAGHQVWSKVVTGQVILNGYLHGDSLFVCGSESIDAAPKRHQNPTFSVLSVKDGHILHQQTLDFYDGDDGYGEGFSHVVYDGRALYLGGHTGTQHPKSFLVKLSREGNTTNIGVNNAGSNFSIFPNPSGSKFTISCDKTNAASLKVTVRNSLGQVVQKKEIQCEGQKSWELDLGKQPAGNYSIEILSGKEKTVKKVVVE